MPGRTAPLRVAIVGGGIGGLFTALCIHHRCKDQPLQIDVYEQAAEYKEIGAGVGLGINAAKLVHYIGLGDKLNAIAGTRGGVWMSFRRFDNGEEIVAIPNGDQTDIRQAPCARSDFLDLFKSAIEDRKAATLHTHKKCLKVEDNNDTVTLHFADSTTANADVVIACDGIHSNVRNQFIHDKPIYSGQIAYRATIPRSELADLTNEQIAGNWCAKRKHFLTFLISADKTLNVVAFADATGKDAEKTAESWTSSCDRREVEDDYASFEPLVQRLISLMPEKPSKWRINDREPLDTWYYFGGKVVLLGDAAHAMQPHMGAGAGQAIEDAWVLARVLGEYTNGSDPERLGTLEKCADFYQGVRKPRAQKVQKASRIAGQTYDMMLEGMADKPYDECTDMLKEATIQRMKYVWEEDLDKAYEKAKKEGTNSTTNGHT